MYCYSAKNNSFFEKDRVDYYNSCGWDLFDVVDVSVDQFIEFTRDKTGFVREPDENGYPSWSAVSKSSEEVYEKSYEAYINYLRSELSVRMSDNDMILVPAKKSINIATSEEIEKLTRIIAEVGEINKAIESGKFIDLDLLK